MFETITINGERLAYELSYGKNDKCLDFETGEIVGLQGCPESQLGEGCHALHQGNRFIRIRRLDELGDEWKARYDGWEFEETSSPQSGHYSEWAAFLHDELAGEETAMRWIRWLRPSCVVQWLEEGFGITRAYDPTDASWRETM